MKKKVIRFLFMFFVLAVFNLFINNYIFQIQDTLRENMNNKEQLSLLIRHLNIKIYVIYISAFIQLGLIVIGGHLIEKIRN